MWLWPLSSWYFLSHVFVSAQCFSSPWWWRKAMTFKLKNKVILFWPWWWVYFSLHFKVEKSHSSMDITCKICYNVAFAAKHGFWLSYCFVLSAAPSWHVWWDLLVCFYLTAVKHYQSNMVISCLSVALKPYELYELDWIKKKKRSSKQ